MHKSLVFFFAVLIVSASSALASSQSYIPAHQINFGTGNKYLSVRDASLTGPGCILSLVDDIKTNTNPNHAN